jgi:hypothetical protein
MRKAFMFLALLFLIAPIICFGTSKALLTTAVDVGAGVTKYNMTDFNSPGQSPEHALTAGITVEYTRAAGSASTLDVDFEISFDGGTTWATFEGASFQVATNHSVISGNTVRVFKEYNLFGAFYLRVKSIKNNDASNGVTAVQVYLSFR